MLPTYLQKKPISKDNAHLVFVKIGAYGFGQNYIYLHLGYIFLSKNLDKNPPLIFCCLSVFVCPSCVFTLRSVMKSCNLRAKAISEKL